MRVCGFQDFSEYENKNCISEGFLFIDQGVLESGMTFCEARISRNTGEEMVKKGGYFYTSLWVSGFFGIQE